MKTLVFDFDGTLADTLHAGIKAYNKVALKYKLSLVQEDKIPELRNKSMTELVKESGISKWRIPFFARSVKNEFRKYVADCELFPGIEEMLFELSNDFAIYILTSNSKENIELFFTKHAKLRSKIKKIYSESSIFGKDKGLKKLMRKEGIENNDIVYIGDEVRDYLACRKIGIKCISVTWGYNSKEILEQYNPSIVKSVRELVSEIY